MTSRLSLSGAAMVLLAATIWGVGGVMVNTMVDLGMPPFQVVFYSNGLAFLVLLVVMTIVAPRYVLVGWREVPRVSAGGLLGAGVSFTCYANAVALTTVSLATVLLYTAPAWVTLLAWRFLGEQVGSRRVLAVIAAFIGCALVARLYHPDALQGSLIGVGYGLVSGFGYGAAIVVGKHVLVRHHPLSVALFGSGATALLVLPFQSTLLPTTLPGTSLLWLVAFLIGPTIVAPVVFNIGLRRLQAGLVTLLGMWELVVAVALGVVLLSEPMELPQAFGVLLVAASVIVLRPTSPPEPPTDDLEPARVGVATGSSSG